jgi:hypothetical protein
MYWMKLFEKQLYRHKFFFKRDGWRFQEFFDSSFRYYMAWAFFRAFRSAWQEKEENKQNGGWRHLKNRFH